jgi:hypothetical protein
LNEFGELFVSCHTIFFGLGNPLLLSFSVDFLPFPEDASLVAESIIIAGAIRNHSTKEILESRYSR